MAGVGYGIAVISAEDIVHGADPQRVCKISCTIIFGAPMVVPHDCSPERKQDPDFHDRVIQINRKAYAVDHHRLMLSPTIRVD